MGELLGEWDWLQPTSITFKCECGKWIDNKDYDDDYETYECSSCGRVWEIKIMIVA